MATEAEIRSKLEPLLPDGVSLLVFPHDKGPVVNINRRDGDLTRADVDAARSAFGELGWAELDAWLARQGISWLSDGVFAGVSFKLEI